MHTEETATDRSRSNWNFRPGVSLDQLAFRYIKSVL